MDINRMGLREQFVAFIRESNRIEGIHRDPTEREVDAFDAFMSLSRVTVRDLERLVDVIQPGAKLRRMLGCNVIVGNHVPPSGGPLVEEALTNLLRDIEQGLDAWHAHVRYETLHPFTDGNGRSGRALWAWQMGPFKLQRGFLHSFYYQTLSNSGR